MSENLGISKTPSYEEVKAGEDERNRAELADLGAEYRHLEESFAAEYTKKEEEFAGTEGKQARLDYILKKYEGEVRHNRFLAGLAAKSVVDKYELADRESLAVGGMRVEDSVEVKSAGFYAQRLVDLKAAISESEQDETQKQEDIARLEQTLGLVLTHVESQYSETNNYFEAKNSDRVRTEAHNKIIDQLNWMNAVAEKYGVRRFTCRDFITSRNYDIAQDKYGAAGRRMRMDRAMVEKYFEGAYRERVRSIRRRLGRSGLMGFGHYR